MKRLLIPQARIPSLLDGTMTQYRVPMWPQPGDFIYRFQEEDGWWKGLWIDAGQDKTWGAARRCPFGKPGDLVWVPEAWKYCDFVSLGAYRFNAGIMYQHGGSLAHSRRHGGGEIMDLHTHWRSAASMPRHASRITLEITRVWVERVQEITVEGTRKEAIFLEGMPMWAARQTWIKHWDRTHGPGSWDQNPWVWGCEFRRVT